jgi:hypothetical protein
MTHKSGVLTECKGSRDSSVGIVSMLRFERREGGGCRDWISGCRASWAHPVSYPVDTGRQRETDHFSPTGTK